MTKTILLIRVSSKEQETNHSLEAQLDKLQDYCIRKDYSIDKTYRLVESSTQGERPEFYKMISWITDQKSKVRLLVDAIDRLQRKSSESAILEELINQDKLELHFMKESLVIHKDSTPAEYLMWDMSVIVAKNLIRSSAYNIKRSNRKKVEEGEYIRKAPVGYLNYRDKDNRSQIKIDPDTGFYIRKAFQMYATGNHSVSSICKYLNKNRVTTSSKYRKLISRSAVSKMLKNRFYVGYMHVYGKYMPHKYEKLVDIQTFNKCQAILKKQRRSKNKKNTKLEYVFQGMLINTKTGRVLSGSTVKGNVYYRSPKFKESPASQNIAERLIMKEALSLLDDIQISKEVLKRQSEKLKDAFDDKQKFNRQLLESKEKQIKEIQFKLSNLLDMRLSGSITQDLYDKKVHELKDEEIKLQAEISAFDDSLEKFTTNTKYLLDLCSRIPELFHKANTSQKRQLLQILLSNFQVDGKKVQYVAKKPFCYIIKCNNMSDWYSETHLS